MDIEYLGFTEDEVALLSVVVYHAQRSPVILGPDGLVFEMTDKGYVHLEKIEKKLEAVDLTHRS